MSYNGNDLIELGFKPGVHFAEMLKVANSMADHAPHAQIVEALSEIYDAATYKPPVIPLKETGGYDLFLDAGRNEYEEANVNAVLATMDEVVKTPTVVDAAIMPDACPAGPVGTIPVGGVVVANNAIHPGMHSSDICCSMFLTKVDGGHNVSDVLDAVQKVSHFGPGGRKDVHMERGREIIDRAKNNSFLSFDKVLDAMSDHLGTQGDGNHFFFVGEDEAGRLTFVTHHGSRNPGALLYKQGMRVAERFRNELSPDTLKQNAWIPADTMEGREYWKALQIIREWTKCNHTVIHDAVMRELGMTDNNIVDRFWNEHNFVFRAGNHFFHAKGSTPVDNSAHDADPRGRTIIPLNMGQPILIVKDHPDNKWGFAPHGAGRNMSRTAFNKLNAGKSEAEILEEQTRGIDARFYCGTPDLSELPGAYKDPDEVIRQIESYKLAHIVEKIKPLGSMMAGDFPKPWRNK